MSNQETLVTEDVRVSFSVMKKIKGRPIAVYDNYIDMDGAPRRVIKTLVPPDRVMYWCINTGEYLGDGL